MKSNSRRRLGLEQLESRDLFAGDVSVRVVRGDLVIRGDDASNTFSLQQAGPGSFTITPGTGTTLNGRTTAQTFAGVIDDVFIDTFGGNDRITFGTTESRTRLPDDVRIRTGAGADSVLVQRVVARNGTIIMGGNTENDVDRLTVKSSIYTGAALIQLGNGNDIANILNSQARGSLRAEGAGGNDTVTISNGTVGDFTLYCGAGDDTAVYGGRFKITGEIYADGGPGIDTDTRKPGTMLEYSDPNPVLINFE